MNCLELTLPTPEENLALDEALLDLACKGATGEVLRFWESPQPFVVVGYANKVETEADIDACRRDHVPVFRRCSGGGTVLQGQGSLNYSLILEIPEKGPLATIHGTNCFILGRHKIALQELVNEAITVEGHSDLALGGVKFSGNAQRRKQSHLLFHGTFLWNADLSMMGKYLRFPSQQPEYRANRAHSEFVRNLPCPAAAIKSAIKQIWEADGAIHFEKPDSWNDLVSKYSGAEWNFKI